MLFTKITRVFVSLILTLTLLTGCQDRSRFSFDFETEDILDTLPWKCKTFFSLSKKHATSGQKSLKIELYPSPYPGITLNKFNPNWSNFNVLKFDVYNEEQIPLRLAIRIDGKKDPSYSDRYRHAIILNTGMNNISIPLNTLHTSGTDRNINHSSIQSVTFFLVQPKEKRIIYIDNIRLE